MTDNIAMAWWHVRIAATQIKWAVMAIFGRRVPHSMLDVEDGNPMTLQAAEDECAAVARAKGDAPRVSLRDIEAAIAARYDVTGRQAVEPSYTGEDWTAYFPDELDTLSICILVVHNGFMVIGKSAPASPANFDAELGRKLAYEDAVRQLWPLMGFALRDRISQGW